MIDLHTHSTFSDGTFTPAQLISEAEKNQLSAIALTDHNTIAGLPEFRQAAAESRVEAVPGIEFTTEYKETELHILGLFLPEDSYGHITKITEDAHKRKEQSNRELVKRLAEKGYEISFEELESKSPTGNFNRAHIAALLAAKGYTQSIDEAFRTLLSPEYGLYVPQKRLQALDIIREIKAAGALALIAHPFINLNLEGLRDFLAEAKECGLDGMEVYYSLYNAETTKLALSLAEEFGLLKSGGSDFHGGNKPNIHMGTGRGNLAVPEEFLEKLKGEVSTNINTNRDEL